MESKLLPLQKCTKLLKPLLKMMVNDLTNLNQGSVLYTLLFAVVMNHIRKDAGEDGLKELFYAENLVLLNDIWKKVEMRYAGRKKSMTEKV